MVDTRSEYTNHRLQKKMLKQGQEKGKGALHLRIIQQHRDPP